MNTIFLHNLIKRSGVSVNLNLAIFLIKHNYYKTFVFTAAY